MADEERPPPVPDETLAALARDGAIGTVVVTETIRRIADELTYRRRIMKEDSRAAQQLKKLRWLTENTLSKIEKLESDDRFGFPKESTEDV